MGVNLGKFGEISNGKRSEKKDRKFLEKVKLEVAGDNIEFGIEAEAFVNEKDTIFIPLNKDSHGMVGTIFLGKVTGLYKSL